MPFRLSCELLYLAVIVAASIVAASAVVVPAVVPPSPPLDSPPAALCCIVRLDKWSSWCCVRCWRCYNFTVVLVVGVVLAVVVMLSCELLYLCCRSLCCRRTSCRTTALGLSAPMPGVMKQKVFLNVKTVTRLLIYQTGQSSNCPHGNLFWHGFALRVKIW